MQILAKMVPSIVLIVLTFFAGVLLCQRPAEGRTLVIGRVSNNPNKNYGELKPLVEYVAAQMKDLGVTEGTVLLAKNKEEMTKFFHEGKVDWATKGIFQALYYIQASPTEMLLRSWREGVPDYYSVIFARKDSGVRSLNDLKGKKIAFQDRGSTSAYFVPVAMLKRAGLELEELDSPRIKVPPGHVGFAFAREELNIATWVHQRITDAGAFHNQDWENPKHNPAGMKQDMTIIQKSKPLPRMIEVVRKDLEPNIKARLKDILLKIHQDPIAKQALKSYSSTTKFDEIEGEAKAEVEEARRMMKFIGSEL
jgi:phosphonate transport system substrate-binding protein